MNNDAAEIRLAKIIAEHSHDWIEKNPDVKWTEPSYAYHIQKVEASIKLAQKILNAGYQEKKIDI